LRQRKEKGRRRDRCISQAKLYNYFPWNDTTTSHTACSYYWTRTWGADDAGILATDQTGKLYVFGSFHNRVDFDPSISVDERDAGNSNPYISMFDYDGNYLDVITFGGNSLTYAFGLAIDSDRNILVSGGFYSSVDFDISLGEDIHASNGNADAYLSNIVY